MKLHLKTDVRQDYKAVFEAFDEALFRELAPPYPRLKLLRFDGSLPGDRVEVELRTGFSRHRWTSLITERSITETEAYFTDEGQELPPPLRYWKHKHLITQNSTGATIHDIIEYNTGNKFLDTVLYPFMLAGFGIRKPVYQNIFGKV